MPTNLGRSYVYWYAPPLNGGHQFADPFLGRVQDLGEFSSVEQFWEYYCHLIRPSNLQLNSSYYIFRSGVSPMWEDPENQMGGRLLLRIPKALSSRCWENLILAFIGEQLSQAVATADDESGGNFVCGVGVTTKKAHDVLSVWHTEDSRRLADRLREAAQRALALPVMLQWEYRKNAESIHSTGGTVVGSPPSFVSPVQSPGDFQGGGGGGGFPASTANYSSGGGPHNRMAFNER